MRCGENGRVLARASLALDNGLALFVRDRRIPRGVPGAVARRQTLHRVVSIRVEEERHRVAGFAAGVVGKVSGAQEAVVRPLPEQFSRVHNERVVDNGNRNPLLSAFAEDIEAGPSLQKQGEECGVDVRGDPEVVVGYRLVWWVVRESQAPKWLRECFGKEVGFEIQGYRVHRQQTQRECLDGSGVRFN